MATRCDPAQVQLLSADDKASYLAQFSDALTGTFWYVVPLLGLAVVCAAALRERPLRSHVHADLPAEV